MPPRHTKGDKFDINWKYSKPKRKWYSWFWPMTWLTSPSKKSEEVKTISIEGSYDFFIDTLALLDKEKLKLDDETLLYWLDEIESDGHVFLHEWTVDRIIAGGMFPLILRSRVLSLRSKIQSMTRQTTADSYRTDPAWKRIRIEAKAILLEAQAFNGLERN